jgi:hypothetical protein
VRKLFLLLIALASIAFGVCSSASAQSSPILGFPPGVFDNLAARSPPPSGGSNNTALDGSATVNFSSGLTHTLSLTTTQSSDLIIVDLSTTPALFPLSRLPV